MMGKLRDFNGQWAMGNDVDDAWGIWISFELEARVSERVSEFWGWMSLGGIGSSWAQL